MNLVIDEEIRSESPDISPDDEPIAIDPMRMQMALDRLRMEQNLPLGLVAGFIAAAIGSAIWALVTIGVGYQIGWIAVGIGFLVGYAIRIMGKGIDNIFGICGGVLAFLGCAVGNLFAVCGLIAKQEEIGFLEVVSQLDFALIKTIMTGSFSFWDLLFYGIAIYEGYKFSFRRITENELADFIPPSQS